MRAPPTKTILRVLQGLALAALAAHAAHNTLGLWHPQADTLFSAWVYNGLMLGAALACLTRGILVRAQRVAWLVLGVGTLSWSAGDIYFSVFLAELEMPPLPSVSDGLFLVFYPCAYIALALLVRRNVREFHASLWIDAVMGALAVSAVASAILYDAIRVGIAGDTLGIATTLAYPVGDIVLLALIIGLFALTGWRPGRTWTMLAAALALSAVGDVAYLYQSAVGGYEEGTLLDSVWPASMLLIASAAWRRQTFSGARLEGLRILLMPTCFACIALTLLVLDQVHELNPLATALACGTIVALVLRMAVTLAENLRMVAASRGEAITDALTGLSNRRKLLVDLEEALNGADASTPRILILFDLDGFKRYNDSYGHLAGDALLARLGAKLRAALEPYGEAYRLGGDEFCAVATAAPEQLEELLAAAALALSDSGEGFEVHASYGAACLPAEATDPSAALQLADQRMYARKDGRMSPVRRETRDVLVRALEARRPDLLPSEYAVAEMAGHVARRLGLVGEGLDEVARAAELHDVGKVAVPDAILGKAEPLSDEEWAFMRRHTILGERILNGAAAMRPVARIVRSSHERFDGSGYPDGLAGEEIPLGARIVAVCDAFEAMTSDRPYRDAMDHDDAVAELRAQAGSQFDPTVVEAFVAEIEADTAPDDGAVSGDERLAYVREVADQLRTALDHGGSQT
jgi:diguanylate cyclase (GGDEF)-like protein